MKRKADKKKQRFGLKRRFAEGFAEAKCATGQGRLCDRRLYALLVVCLLDDISPIFLARSSSGPWMGLFSLYSTIIQITILLTGQYLTFKKQKLI
jgi:hypothetical protein